MLRVALAHFIEIAVPSHPLEFHKRLDLLAYPHEQPQALFHRGSLGRLAGGDHGLG
jgi:hypothetical protein